MKAEWISNAFKFPIKNSMSSELVFKCEILNDY